MKKTFLIICGLIFLNILSAQTSPIYKVDKESILKSIFGNYNIDQTESLWVTSDTSILKDLGIIAKKDTLYTSVLRLDTILFNNANYLLIITQTKPKEYDCHTCAPLIGIVFFNQKNDYWEFKSKYYLTSIGSWGRAVRPKLEHIGKDKFGISFRYGFTGQGYSSLSLLIFEIGLKNSRRIININDYGADNLGNCDEKKSTCWAYTSDYSFDISKKEYFDLVLKTKGTKSISSKIVPIDKIKIYTYLDSSYIEKL